MSFHRTHANVSTGFINTGTKKTEQVFLSEQADTSSDPAVVALGPSA